MYRFVFRQGATTQREIMNSISAQDLERRGLAAVDEALGAGPVHVIKNDRPSYVVLTEEGFQELLEAKRQATLDSIRMSLEDLRAGRVTRHENVETLMQLLDRDEDEGPGLWSRPGTSSGVHASF